MDLKFKGMSWVGNFCQKFEKVCHEVDDIVNQEAVKYVESQVQSVSKNMKKFYSDVITDMLHPLMDPVKHDVQEKSPERNVAIHSHIGSEMGFQENHADEENEQSHFEPSEFDPIKKQPDDALSSLHLVEQWNLLTNMNSLEAANSDQAPRQIADGFATRISKLKFEEGTLTETPCFYEVSELTSLGKEEFVGDSLQSESVDCNDKISNQFPDEITGATSVLGEKFQPNDNVIISPDSFADDSKRVSDSSSALKPTEVMSSIVSSEKNAVDAIDLRSRSPLRETPLLENSNENLSARAESWHSPVDVAGPFSHTQPPSSLSPTTLSSENKVSEMGLTSSSTVLSSELVDCSSALRSPEVMSSIVSSEENIVDAADFSSKAPSRESFLLENSNDNSPERAVSCNSHSDVAGHVSHTVLQSSMSTTNIFSENEKSEMGSISSSIVLPSELVDSLKAFSSTEMKTSVVSSEKNIVDATDISSMSPLRGSFFLDNRNENSPARTASSHSMVDVAELISHNVVPSSLSSITLSGEKMVSDTRLVIPSSVLSSEVIIDDSNDEVNVSSMETIDLCDKVKLEDSCVYVDNTALYAVSRTLKKHRSYKQMLRDALTAKRRVVKEYEQLAIWFGDADMGSDKESMQTLLPSTTATTTMECGNLRTDLEGDSGWELL